MKTIKKNTQVEIKHILGETAEVLVTRLDNGKYQFNCDAYVVGEYCKGGFFHLRQAREVISGKKLGNNVKFWPRLRRALHEAGLEPVNIPGGDYPIHYRDEIVIPDYSMSGAHYFIIKRSDISKYLDMFPLDDAGKAHAEDVARIEAEAAAEAYRQAHDPKCIANRIGDKLWYSGGMSFGGEFKKITLVADDDSEFSVMFQDGNTNLIWPSGCCNVAKVLCTAPETGIEYLSGLSAGHLDPRKHSRLKKIYSQGWHEYTAYLMPNPKLATEVRESSYWLGMFKNSDNDSISAELIASAKKVVLEAYDLDDKLLKQRYVYDRESGEVSKEYLHNWPFDLFNEKVTGEFDWSTEEE